MAVAAWFDGAAIYIAVLVVSGFSAFVDWRKEKEFAMRSRQDAANKFVSRPATRRGLWLPAVMIFV